MRKTIYIFCLISILVSCGKKESSQTQETRTLPQSGTTSNLSIYEVMLKQRLLSLKSISQKDLMLELLKLKDLNESSLKKLDQFINVKCFKSSGTCDITLKD